MIQRLTITEQFDCSFHHTGCVVESVEDYLATYSPILANRRRSATYHVSSQDVRVVFVELAPDCFLELVEPQSRSTLRGIRTRGTGYYHICFRVRSLPTSTELLEDRGFRSLGSFASEAFAGSICCFFMDPYGYLLELVEATENRLPTVNNPEYLID